MNAARRRPRGRAHCHGRALFADHNPQLPMQLEVLSTARDASVAGMGRKDEVGHATSALVLSAIARSSPKARTLLRYRHDLFHLIHPSFVPQEGISVVSYLNRRSFEHLHLAVVLTSTRSGMRSSAARMHALTPNGSGPVPRCGRRTEEDGACWDEVLHLSALSRGGPSRISRISYNPPF